MSPHDELAMLERAVVLAATARENGDHPFGCVIVARDGSVVEGLNTVVTGSDPTGHAETNAVRAAGSALTDEQRAGATLFTSTEPCAMCTGAIYWSGIGRIVYALGEDELRDLVHAQEGIPTLSLPSREVLARGGRVVEVIGPVPLASARAVHEGFWNA